MEVVDTQEEAVVDMEEVDIQEVVVMEEVDILPEVAVDTPVEVRIINYLLKLINLFEILLNRTWRFIRILKWRRRWWSWRWFIRMV